MDYVLNFQEVDKNSLPLVGGKNASLGEMIKADIPVPPGFAVTTESYHEFITESGIRDDIFRVLSEMKKGDITSLNTASALIQDMIQKSTLPENIRMAIEKAYVKLCDNCRVLAMPVAVRSSATAEDLPNAVSPVNRTHIFGFKAPNTWLKRFNVAGPACLHPAPSTIV